MAGPAKVGPAKMFLLPGKKFGRFANLVKVS